MHYCVVSLKTTLYHVLLIAPEAISKIQVNLRFFKIVRVKKFYKVKKNIPRFTTFD